MKQLDITDIKKGDILLYGYGRATINYNWKKLYEYINYDVKYREVKDVYQKKMPYDKEGWVMEFYEKDELGTDSHSMLVGGWTRFWICDKDELALLQITT